MEREKRTQTLHIRIRPTLKQKLERSAALENLSTASLVERLLERGLKHPVK